MESESVRKSLVRKQRVQRLWPNFCMLSVLYAICTICYLYYMLSALYAICTICYLHYALSGLFTLGAMHTICAIVLCFISARCYLYCALSVLYTMCILCIMLIYTCYTLYYYYISFSTTVVLDWCSYFYSIFCCDWPEMVVFMLWLASNGCVYAVIGQQWLYLHCDWPTMAVSLHGFNTI